jgi:hypothetical protein
VIPIIPPDFGTPDPAVARRAATRSQPTGMTPGLPIGRLVGGSLSYQQLVGISVGGAMTTITPEQHVAAAEAGDAPVDLADPQTGAE